MLSLKSRLKNTLRKKISNLIEDHLYNKFNRKVIVSGENIKIHTDVKLSNAIIRGDVEIGKKSMIIDGVIINGKLKIGEYTSINGPNTSIFSKINGVEIGNYCSIARNVTIQEYNHFTDHLSTYYILKNYFNEPVTTEVFSKGRIIIGNDVWIGANVTILSGAQIGDGAIVGANSVISGKIPPFAIVGGSPAKSIRFRFSEEVIQKLLKIKWWCWDEKKMEQNKDLFRDAITIEKLNNIV
jgi:acetyltransferase-like isoleucine patch superfamily enzyme